nr:HNH endonuclease [Bacillus subtilis]
MDKSLYLQKDTAQFKKATELLQQEINKNPELKKHFTEIQLKQISKGKKPKGFTCVDVKSKFTFFAYLLFTLLLKIHFFDVSFDSYLHPYE